MANYADRLRFSRCSMKIDKRFFIFAGIILLLTLSAYAPSFHGDFLWDDDDHVSNNELLRDFDGLRRSWFEIGSFPQYYPVTLTSFWLNYQTGGLDTTGYHVVNILLHAFNAILLGVILSRLGVPAAWFIALVFALHPVNVESAAWISERKNTLSGFFYLASLLSALLFFRLDNEDVDDGDSKYRSHYLYAASLIFFLFALLSKTVTATLPAVILLIIWWKKGRFSLKDTIYSVPVFLIGIGMGVLSVYMEKHFAGAKGSSWDYGFVERVLIAGRALCFYAMKLLIPYKLTFSYPRWNIDASSVLHYIFPLIAVAAAVMLFIYRKKIGRGPLAALLFFYGTLFPALGFFNVYPFLYSFVADHFQYLASIGMIVLIVMLLRIAARKTGLTGTNGTVAAVIICALLWSLTWRQAHIYGNQELLYLDTLKKNPQSWMAHNNLGIYYDIIGNYKGSINHYKAAIALDPGHAKAHYNLANVLVKLEHFDEGIAHFKEALHYDPDDLSAYINLGNTYKRLERYDEAIAEYNKAIEKKNDFAEGYYNLGLCQLTMGDAQGAVESLKEALRIDPTAAETYNNLGNAYSKLNDNEHAIQYFKKAISLKPDHVYAHYNIALIYSKMEKYQEAVPYYRASLKLNPGFASAHKNLGLVLHRLGQEDLAQKHLEAAQRLGR